MLHGELEARGLAFPEAGLAIDEGAERGIVRVGCTLVMKDCTDGER